MRPFQPFPVWPPMSQQPILTVVTRCKPPVIQAGLPAGRRVCRARDTDPDARKRGYPAIARRVREV